MLIAGIRCTEGTVSPTSAVRMPISEGLTNPRMAVVISTSVGVTASMKAATINTEARVAYNPRIAQSTMRCPMRSPMTPNIGDSRVPTYCSEAKIVSISTDWVSTSTYQPRMSISISMAQDAARSAGH